MKTACASGGNMVAVLRRRLAETLLRRLDHEINKMSKMDIGFCSRHNSAEAAIALLADDTEVTGAVLCELIEYGLNHSSAKYLLESALESTDCTCTELEIKERRAEEMGEAIYEATR